ncbi:restriction endonuclease subunit S [Cryobacterium lyxosi]|uniref:Restriction endonuclease subunit S n=1 Tax=Cryobacterium lyxosi TaxID=1259228 RepID=A0A4V3IPC3_9MICO|nr:restriction endonuclease subunit S [Cryobacterium lyxosi]TFD27352.1 restriction endonuclease subunit S [Cryobacterium lyxosi]
MSRIDDLIGEYCPNGVEVKSLSDVAETVSGLSGKAKADFSDGNARFVSYKNAFANLAVDLEAPDFVKVGLNEKQNRLQKGDVVVTGSSENFDEVGMSSVVVREPDEVLYLNSFCFALRFHDSALFLPDFSKYLFRSESVRSQIRRAASGVTRINVSKPRFMRIRIPVPPREVQCEIVRILDQFTQLEAELEAELEARRRQYASYRDSLVTTVDGPRVPMGELGTFMRGRRFTKSDVVESGIPSIHYGEIYTDYGVSASSANREVNSDLVEQLRFAQPRDVIFAGVGETVLDVGKAVAWLGDGPVAVHDDTFSFTSGLDPKYVAYAVQTDDFHAQKSNHVARGKVKRLSSAGLSKIRIPVPSAEEQARIVSILDNFDSLVNDLSIGLPAELNARRKQYEYYRDKLLTFKEMAA